MTRLAAVLFFVLLAGFVLIEREPLHALEQLVPGPAPGPGPGPAPTPAPSCDLAAVSRTKAEFLRLSALRRFDARGTTIDTVRAASLEYVAVAEACYQQGQGPRTIDAGGLTVSGPGGSAQFSIFGTKWGLGSPFASTGPDSNGPRTGGGTVSYSFMTDGLDGFQQVEGGNPGLSVALSSLPGFAPCFIEELSNAFAIWSAVSNIQFTRVEDTGSAFNAAGASGDIRIAAHAMDGASGVLAHGYYPPPNGSSAAGDIHFDLAENWSCAPGAGSIDLGIVAAHEIGHAIGLNHELRSGAAGRAALMNPNYNPLVAPFPLGDDINGAENLYGSAVGNGHDAIAHFVDGVSTLDYGTGWSPLADVPADQIVTGDLDGNGIDEIVVDFGTVYGAWIRMNNAGWIQLTSDSPSYMAAGDLDNSGRDDLILSFSGAGVWRWMNHAFWQQLHDANSPVFAVGNLDNLAGDDVAFTLPGWGVWRWTNNATWAQVTSDDATHIAVGDLDETLSVAGNADDLVLNVPGGGVYVSVNMATPFQLHASTAIHLATGDMTGDGRDELLLDLGGAEGGIYIVDILSGVRQLHPVESEGLVLGDLDGNGLADVLVDFGETYGLWLFVNNASWIHVHAASSQGLAVGDLN
jgi:hypothetical protein